MFNLTFREGLAGAMQANGKLGGVLPLTLALDIGDIAGIEDDMHSRREVLEALFGDFPGVPREIWRSNLRTLERLRGAGRTGEAVRVWVKEDDPAELCGLYFICHMLGNGNIELVRIPAEWEESECVSQIHSSDELTQLDGLVEQAEALSSTRRDAYAMRWEMLQRENAPLRAVINGRIMGVPEDFYDFALRANLPNGECPLAQIIGKAMAQLPGVGDRWLFLRLQAMLRAGELTEISPPDAEHPYTGVVRYSP